MKTKQKYKNNTSGVPGLSQNKRTGKWRAQSSINGKQFHVGYYWTKHDALKGIEDWRQEMKDCGVLNDEIPATLPST